MKMKCLLAVMALGFGMAGCSSVNKIVYRIDVPQGNYLEQAQIDLLKVGMSKAQVQYVLGNPVLNNAFAQNRWDYVFIQRKGHEKPIQRTLFVYFDEKGLVSDIRQDQAIEKSQ